MRGSEILKEIDQRPVSGLEFIRWWRCENDFADYELIDDFREMVDGTQEFEGFELLDVDEMWSRLVNLDPKRIARHKGSKSDVIVWRHPDDDGNMLEETHPFSAQSLMTIFDAETKGDTLV